MQLCVENKALRNCLPASQFQILCQPLANEERAGTRTREQMSSDNAAPAAEIQSEINECFLKYQCIQGDKRESDIGTENL